MTTRRASQRPARSTPFGAGVGGIVEQADQGLADGLRRGDRPADGIGPAQLDPQRHAGMQQLPAVAGVFQQHIQGFERGLAVGR
jgi:hypothetical protein